MDNNAFPLILKHAKTEFPKDAKDIRVILDLLIDSIKQLKEETDQSLSQLAANGEHNKVNDYNNISRMISDLQKTLAHYVHILDADDNDRSPDNALVTTVTPENDTPHKLSDDFTYTKPYRFTLMGETYSEVRSWKDVLLRVCEILYDKDPQRILEFADNPAFKGRQMPYFGTKSVPGRNAPIGNSDVYVCHHKSANAIRDLIRKMLTELHIDPAEFQVYWESKPGMHRRKKRTKKDA